MIFKPWKEELKDAELLILMLVCIPIGLLLSIPTYLSKDDNDYRD